MREDLGNGAIRSEESYSYHIALGREKYVMVPGFALRHLCRRITAYPIGLHCDASSSEGHTEGRTPDLDRILHVMGHANILLDTADACGRGSSERLIGRFLRKYSDRSPLLSSKVGKVRGSAPHPFAGRHIHHQLEQSLDNLYAEQLDLYTLDSLDFGKDDRYLGNAIDLMYTLREVGAINAIGMRGPDPAVSLEERTAQAKRFLYLFQLIKPDVVWVRFDALTLLTPIEGEDNLLSFTARHGAGLVLAAFPTLRKWGNASEARLTLRSCLQRYDHCVALSTFDAERQVLEALVSMAARSGGGLDLLDDLYADRGSSRAQVSARDAI